MRTLIAIASIAVLGAAALGYAWHLLGEVPARAAAAPEAVEAPREAPESATELARVEVDGQPPPIERTPAGFEEGGAAPFVRDHAAVYAERTPEERRAAALRLAAEILAARQALGAAELDELAGRTGNRPTTPGVARLLALLEERAWLQASLAGTPQALGEGER